MSMDLKAGIRSGLISLGVLLYLDLVGLPKTTGRPVVVVFALVVLFFGILFTRRKPDVPARRLTEAVVHGLTLGLISGLGLALVTYTFAALQANRVRVNEVFAQVLPEHTGALTGLTKEEVLAGASALPGLIQLVALLTAAGLAGSLLTRLPSGRLRAYWGFDNNRPVRRWTPLLLPFLVFAMFLALRLESVEVTAIRENIVGLFLIYVFIGASLFALRAAKPGRQKVVLGLLLGALMLWVPQLADLFQNSVLDAVAIFVIMGIGLNIVVGFAGLLDLGYVAFFAVGAYTYALLSAPESYVVLNLPDFGGISFWMGLPLSILMGAFAGILLGIPVLRMRGDYLAIVTLGFGEIIRLLLVNLRDYTGGPGGILEVPPPYVFGYSLGNPRGILYLAIAMGAVVTFFTLRLRDSRAGRAWIAMREDEDVAQAMGINLVKTKLLAFAMGAAFAGMGGMVYAARQVNIFPDNFALDVSINVLSLIIIGGIGSIEGVVLGSIALIGLPEILRTVDEYRIIAFGALLVMMMILRPEGMLPSARRQQELHAEEEAQPAQLQVEVTGD